MHKKRAAYRYQIFEKCHVKGADNSSVITCTLGSQCFSETKGPTSINDAKKCYGTLMIEVQNKKEEMCNFSSLRDQVPIKLPTICRLTKVLFIKSFTADFTSINFV
jgi:hypothetical protein